ncbi:gamma-glutamyltransferase family protein [Oceanicola sp. S124]|uniref:gamma-glutamyltransferase family protein n=1 Tax=Oceanicola sp. S124 TaxID=1042378 RepID=UPI00025585DC|nr:gamma-glutamyltransferase [Oceanicola sp. S124]
MTTPHPLATEIGQRVLDAGGTAPEAIIAAGAVLSVVAPHFCGLGGDAVWLVADRKGDRRCFLAIGQGLQRPAPTAPIPDRGRDSVLTSAAVVDGWAHALDYSTQALGGTARWEDLIGPAASIAREGHRVSRSQAFWTAYRHPEIADWPGFEGVFVLDGRPRPAGALMRQPALAETLETLAERGARDFYEGTLSRRILAGLNDQGIAISAADLARTRTRETAPLSTPYRDRCLLAPPPPTQGITFLQIMGSLGRLDLADLSPGSAAHLHLCIEAVKQAFRDRRQIADPRFANVDVQRLLSAATLDTKAAAICPNRALPWPDPWQHGDTAFLGAIDSAGNAASVLQSTYFDWGAGVMAGDTGIVWQNRGAAFSASRGHPNAFAPGKLPFYTLTPGIALDADGHPEFAFGTQGADGQPQTLSVVLTHLIDYHASPSDALSAPRFLLGRTFSDQSHSLKVEGHAGQEVMAGLAARGHDVAPILAYSPLAGQAGLVLGAASGTTGYHDPRH